MPASVLASPVHVTGFPTAQTAQTLLFEIVEFSSVNMVPCATTTAAVAGSVGVFSSIRTSESVSEMSADQPALAPPFEHEATSAVDTAANRRRHCHPYRRRSPQSPPCRRRKRRTTR